MASSTIEPLHSSSLEDEPPEVEPQGIDHKGDEQHEADGVGDAEELVAGLPAGDHLYEDEEDVAAVEARDRDDVHEGEDDAQQRGHAPETVPVPHLREDAADGQETA